MNQLEVLQILFQSAMRSKIFQKNFQDIKNFCNDLKNQFNNFLTPPAGNEVSNARDYFPVLRERLRSGSKGFGNLIIRGGQVSAHGSPDMALFIEGGEALIDGTGCIWGDMNTSLITPPTTFMRYDTVVTNSDNTVTVMMGNESANPVLPTLSITQKKLAHLKLSPGMTAITQAEIYDARKERFVGFLEGFSEPIGIIKAWHKNFPNVPEITDEWLECNGQTVDDLDSPLHGQILPLLNGNTTDGGKFLRGISTGGQTGETQESQNKDHNHLLTDPGHVHSMPDQGGPGVYSPAYRNYYVVNQQGTANRVETNLGYTGISLANEGGSEARPTNMSVVWIMRVK